MPSSPRPVSPRWKGLLAGLSLALAGFIWLSGLVDSLSRPSVAPTLSLQQQELTLLAEPAVPSQLRDSLLGASPRSALLKALEEISPDDRSERQQRMLELLQGNASSSATPEPESDDPLLQQLLCEVRTSDPPACIDGTAAGRAAFREWERGWLEQRGIAFDHSKLEKLPEVKQAKAKQGGSTGSSTS